MARKRERQIAWWRREGARESVRALIGVLGALSRTILAIAIMLSG